MYISIFNSLSNKFNKINHKKIITFYACGPTVYNYAHIGNLRTYIFEDILRRGLYFFNYKTKHVINITDVGHLQSSNNDKISSASILQKKNPWILASFYENNFFINAQNLNILKPHILCRATKHIYDMQKMILSLIDKINAYNINQNIYFNINSFIKYQPFSKSVNIDLNKSRVILDQNKKNSLDFSLWFFKSKYNNQIMKWNSPWGIGFPGWHIECSAMASKYLGSKIDIHAGGIDHMPIHHSNEIAQSESYWNHKWVDIWIHNNFLYLNNKKMAKSNFSFITLTKLKNKNIYPLDFRYYTLISHYRSNISFNWISILNSQNSFKKLKNNINLLNNFSSQFSAISYQKKFFLSIAHDLNTPIAIKVLWELIKDKKINIYEKKNTILSFDTILGLNLGSIIKKEISLKLKQLLIKRYKSRSIKNWKLADKIKEKLIYFKINPLDSIKSIDWQYISN